MSCTFVGIPVALFWLAESIAVSDSAHGFANSTYKYGRTNSISRQSLHQEEIKFLEKELATPFVDKDILLKTLSEHGASNFSGNGNNLSCKIEDYTLNFTRNDVNSPFLLTIKCPESVSVEKEFDNLSGEYSLNVQEKSYLDVLENLKSNNLQVESEEILEDNTIVLTINVD